MSLTTIKEPEALGFSKNPIWYRFLSGNYLTTPGAKAKYTLKFDSIYVGVQFDLIFNGKTYTLEFVTTPDGTGYQLRAHVNLATFQAAIEDLKLLYELNKHYTITFISWDALGYFGFIDIEAKAPGTIWNMAIDNVSYVPGVTLTTVTAGTDDVYNPNYKVFADLHVQANPAIAPADNLIAQLDADAHKDAVVMALAANEFVFDFELQNLIHSQLAPYVPAWNLAAVTKATDMLVHFWIRYGEIYGSDPKVLWNTYNGAADAYKRVIIGGLELDEVTFTVAPDYTGTALLNRQPSRKIVSKSCQEFLYKYLTLAHTTLQLQCTITYTDGTTWAGLVGTSVGTSVKQSVYVFPTGWDILNLTSKNPSKTPLKYAVYITNSAAAVLSTTQTYVLDLAAHEENNRLLFLGACGAMETVWCHGYRKESLDSPSEQVTSAKLPWYDRGRALLKHTNSSQNIRYTFNTGLKALDYIKWLKELANSDVVLLAESGYWTSIRVDKKSIKEMPTGLTDLYTLSFEADRILHY